MPRTGMTRSRLPETSMRPDDHKRSGTHHLRAHCLGCRVHRSSDCAVVGLLRGTRVGVESTAIHTDDEVSTLRNDCPEWSLVLLLHSGFRSDQRLFDSAICRSDYGVS